MSPRILCISFSNIAADSRVLRQLDVLSEFGAVTTLSYGVQPPGAAVHLEIDESLPSLPQTPAGVVNLALRRYAAVDLAAPAVTRALELVRDHLRQPGVRPFDLIVANEARALPLAHRLAGTPPGTAVPDTAVPVWCDLHEWALEERTHVLSWRLLVKPFMYHVCARYLPRTTAVTAVNESIARLYRECFDIAAQVVRNAGPYQDLTPGPMLDGRIRLVHSGAAVPGRNLEGMIQSALDLGEGYTLDLYLVKARDGGKYWHRLKDLSAGSERITFHDAVAPQQLAAALNRYDLGVFSLPPQTTNHRLMLPNKFFDFVQARLGLVFSPSPETSRLIREHELGAITEDFSTASLTATIRALTRPDIARFKANADTAATALSSTEDEAVQRNILNRLLRL